MKAITRDAYQELVNNMKESGLEFKKFSTIQDCAKNLEPHYFKALEKEIQTEGIYVFLKKLVEYYAPTKEELNK